MTEPKIIEVAEQQVYQKANVKVKVIGVPESTVINNWPPHDQVLRIQCDISTFRHYEMLKLWPLSIFLEISIAPRQEEGKDKVLGY